MTRPDNPTPRAEDAPDLRAAAQLGEIIDALGEAHARTVKRHEDGPYCLVCCADLDGDGKHTGDCIARVVGDCLAPLQRLRTALSRVAAPVAQPGDVLTAARQLLAVVERVHLHEQAREGCAVCVAAGALRAALAAPAPAPVQPPASPTPDARRQFEELMHVDATPDADYLARVLRAHLAANDSGARWIGQSLDGGAEQLAAMMNEWAAKRAALLRAALFKLGAPIDQSIADGSRFVEAPAPVQAVVDLPMCACGRDRVMGTATMKCSACWPAHVRTTDVDFDDLPDWEDLTPAERFPSREFHWYGRIFGPFPTAEKCSAEYARAYEAGESYRPPPDVQVRGASYSAPAPIAAPPTLDVVATIAEIRETVADATENLEAAERVDGGRGERCGNCDGAPFEDDRGQIQHDENCAIAYALDRLAEMEGYLEALAPAVEALRAGVVPPAGTDHDCGACRDADLEGLPACEQCGRPVPKRAPVQAGLVEYLRHCVGECYCVWHYSQRRPLPGDECEEGQRLAAAVAPIAKEPSNG